MNKDISAEYLECVKNSLLNWNEIGQSHWKPINKGIPGIINELLDAIGLSNHRLCKSKLVTLEEKTDGLDWQTSALTMIGKKRLDSLHKCVQDVLEQDIPGYFIETGVWKGGSCIFMRAALHA